MAGWMALFAAASVFSALLGFGGTPNPAAALAQLLFFVCLVALLVSWTLSATRDVSR
jgi:uncharacterized membrane protein YtjA (UPF0391 family)